VNTERKEKGRLTKWERKGQSFERMSSQRFKEMKEKRREGGEWPTSHTIK